MQRGVSFADRDLERQRLTGEDIQVLLAGRPPAAIFSWKSVRARREGIQPGSRSDAELLQLMAADVNLIRRPLLAIGGKLLAGFDPVAWGQILSQ